MAAATRASERTGHTETMCGRYVLASSAEELADAVDALVPGDVALPGQSWNVAPTDPMYAVVEREADGRSSRELHPARWGLIPPWAKDASGAARAINARIETVAQKPSFANAVRGRRCLVPADGYYEWQRLGDRKQPFFIHPADDSPLYFAGIYCWWKDRDIPSGQSGRWTLTTSILTCPSVGEWATIHDRMPVALTLEARDEWLAKTPVTGIAELLTYAQASAEQSAGTWAKRAVGAAVGSVRNNGPGLIEAVGV